jgi:hypothetical protein
MKRHEEEGRWVSGEALSAGLAVARGVPDGPYWFFTVITRVVAAYQGSCIRDRHDIAKRWLVGQSKNLEPQMNADKHWTSAPG